MALKSKIVSIASRASNQCSEISKKLEGIKKDFHERSQQIVKRARANTQKYYLSMSSMKERIDSGQSLRNLRQRGASLTQKKFNVATQRMKSIRDWQAAEVIKSYYNIQQLQLMFVFNLYLIYLFAALCSLVFVDEWNLTSTIS